MHLLYAFYMHLYSNNYCLITMDGGNADIAGAIYLSSSTSEAVSLSTRQAQPHHRTSVHIHNAPSSPEHIVSGDTLST